MPKTCSEPLHRLQLHGPTMATRWAVSCDVPPALDTNALCQALAEVLVRALEVCRLSDGAFDPAVGALVDAWGFGAARDTPDAEAIRAARNSERLPMPQALELDLVAGLARKQAPLQLDLCGIAKGYAVDRMCAVLTGHGVCHALVALDGELRAIGPQASGAPWAVALESPRAGPRAAQGVIELQDLAVATSGDYRHFVQVGQARLAHSMDGRSGKPVNNGVASVTVLAPRCMDADAWATALLVIGPGQGLALAHRHGLEALWLLRRGEALVEPGMPGHGWQYFFNPQAPRAVVISPEGHYYLSHGKGLRWVAGTRQPEQVSTGPWEVIPNAAQTGMPGFGWQYFAETAAPRAVVISPR